MPIHSKKQDPLTIKEEQKISLYLDNRDQKANDTMEGWTLEKLQEVVKTKHSADSSNSTDIICKHFLDAVEKRLYGWFWSCPNGELCKYRHFLPLGYTLKAKIEEQDEEEDIPWEDQIEEERAKLPSGGTRVTLETFNAWKIKKEEDRLLAVEEQQKEAKKTGGKGVLSGRDLFAFDPHLFQDDDDAVDAELYEEATSDEEENEETNQESTVQNNTAVNEDLFVGDDCEFPDDLPDE
eukprot:Platyproteum_vivax@DN5741_c0_g1_i1.p1